MLVNSSVSVYVTTCLSSFVLTPSLYSLKFSPRGSSTWLLIIRTKTVKIITTVLMVILYSIVHFNWYSVQYMNKYINILHDVRKNNKIMLMLHYHLKR